jgi:zinc transporter ZupT
MTTTLGDMRVGFNFSLAIAVHNIPEGLCVAMALAISRERAFCGASKPLGALLRWTILVNCFTPTVYAILLG